MANNDPNISRIADNYFSYALNDFMKDYSLAIENPAKYTQQLLNAAATYESTTNLSDSIFIVQNVYNLAVSSFGKASISRVSFYASHVLLHAGIHLQSLLSLNASIYSARAFANKDIELSTAELYNAIVQVDQIFSLERTAEYGRWRGFFQSDILTGFPIARTNMRLVYSTLTNLPPIMLPYNQYYNWYNYQLAFNNYPYIYNSTENMDFAVTILCNSQSGCINTPVGGNFTTSSASLQMTVGRTGLQIRYTLDGTMPTISSPIYSTPVSISNTTTVTAVAFGNNITFLPSRTIWYYNTHTYNQTHFGNILVN